MITSAILTFRDDSCMCFRAIGSTSSMWVAIGNVLPVLATICSAQEAILAHNPTTQVIDKTHEGHLSDRRQLVPSLPLIDRAVYDTGVLVDCPGMLRVDDVQALQGRLERGQRTRRGLPERVSGAATIVSHVEQKTVYGGLLPLVKLTNHL
jgi:hypothetical protein